MKISLSVRCPKCNAKKGESCRHPSRRKCESSHVERFRALQRKTERMYRAFERSQG